MAPNAQLDALADESAEVLHKIEEKLAALLGSLKAWSVAWWLNAGQGPTNQAPTPAQMAQRVEAVDWAAAEQLLVEAQEEGAVTAVAQLSLALLAAELIMPSLDERAPVVRVAEVRTRLLERLTTVALMPAATQPGFVNQAIGWAEGGLRSAVTELSAEAQMRTGLAHGAALVWHGERNACVTCTGYIGAVVRSAGEGFESVGFDGQPGTLRVPPAHPRCRCQLVVVAGDPEPLALAYRREAVRQVLKGWRLESESNAVRLRAAEALLAKNPAAPRTVKRAAANAVAEGAFGGGGVVPT